ncbi:MAG: hypothetical protein COV07_00685 [Candidatus Vogelbacteria bacterium CG10_big_fil_rev_8_21_14_0_10_45_14]|uniref:AMP-dependent synthetase/ligase domain-containing protein n=1 Tax=Candidatus Vogelbacteria bacterium CG10_big_fil_rev_8_21_14_0_10_45_14 TaxID=1975042 RepID=A0A2H0RN51_9BACT|nr:MAG: hypothetical protein COV07_00685 [Candidatus Vogelbacteria bacterium CG10_big_fil_rev_8_21_14_0_10_45_14]
MEYAYLRLNVCGVRLYLYMHKKTIATLFEEWCEKYAGKIAVVSASLDGEMARYSYKELWLLVEKMRAKIRELGIAKGDRVVVGGPNSIEWGALLLACACEGIVIVPLDTRSEHSFVERVVLETDAKVTFLSRSDTPLSGAKLPPLYILSELVADMEANTKVLPSVDVSTDDIYAIIYTSGTTSAPKGVVLTHGNIASNIESLHTCFNIGRNHTFLSMLPLAHVLEQVGGYLMLLSFGYTIIYPNDPKDPHEITSLLARYKVSALVAVPFILERFGERIKAKLTEKKVFGLVKTFGRLPLSIGRKLNTPFRGPFKNVRYIVSAGAPLLSETKDFWQMLGVEVLQGYGLTETSPVLAIETPSAMRHGSVGLAIPGVSIKIAKDGEILAKGANVFSGYYKNDEATKSALKADWFHTGDMGELDSDGYLYVKGRKKYMLLDSRGVNIYPEDVEAILNVRDDIADSCVMATNDVGKLELTAVVVPAKDATLELETIKMECNKLLGHHQQIVHIIKWEDPEFPKTPSLKNKRDLIRAKIYG